MHRINLTGCGYSIQGGTYTCKPIPKLASVVGSATFVPSVVPLDAIPQHLEGFVMTLAPILDMEPATGLEIPELECRVELDPFKTTADYAIKNLRSEYTKNDATLHDGFLDFYYFGNGYSDRVYIRIDGGDQIKVKSDVSPYIIGGTCSFNSEQVVGPGILEPMLDTEFSPITVDTIPPSDAHFDTTTYLFDIFDAWRELVDMRLNNLHDFVVPMAEQDLTLEVGKNLEGPCGNFQIVLATGTPLAPTKEYEDHPDQLAPKYWITGGTLLVNGYTVGVVGSTVHYEGIEDGTTTHIYGQTVGIGGPFDAYLVLSSGTQPENPYTGRIVVTRDKTLTYNNAELTTYIGKVQMIDNDLPDNLWDITSRFLHSGTEYTEFEIKQGDCITDLEWIAGQENGYIHMTVSANGGRQYAPDPLLNTVEFGHITTTGTPNGSRGVQADAIIDYVATHGGTTGTGGRMYPNYAALATGETAVKTGIGVGVTYVLPVSAGQHIGYLTEAPENCFVRYAPAEGESGNAFTLVEGSTAAATQVADADGFVRFSILDDGEHAGTCVRFVVDDSDWDAALPVYRFGTFNTPTYEYKYNGPFKVSIDGSITCPACENSTLAGHYWINGADRRAVGIDSVDISGATESHLDVYAHVYLARDASTQAVTGYTCSFDTEEYKDANPAAYNVWIAHIGGMTETVIEVAGGTQVQYTGGTVTQIQHGDLYIDGRWS